METSAPPTEARSSGPLTVALLAVVFAVGAVFVTQTGAMNGWYTAFKTLHVLAAVLWVGGGTYLTILAIGAERRRDAEEMAAMARQAARVGEKVFAPAGLVAFLFGVAMMLNTDWGWGEFWVTAGLVGFIVSFVTGIGVLAPLAKKVDASTQENGATHPETVALIRRFLLIARFDIALLLLVVIDMVAKPFA
jgi:uncharacterized membrane protein